MEQNKVAYFFSFFKLIKKKHICMVAKIYTPKIQASDRKSYKNNQMITCEHLILKNTIINL